MAESNDILDQLSPEDLQALADGDAGALSDSGATALANLDERTFAALLGVDVPNVSPQETGRERLSMFLQGTMDISPAAADAITDSPVTDFAVGFGQTAGSLHRGLQQIAASPQEALVLAEMEREARDSFKEFDEGLGAEDVGEAMAFLGTLLVPGGAKVQGAALGGKVLAALKNMGGSLGGTSVLVGLLEGAKGVTPDESRALNAATGAASTFVGGRILQGTGNILKNSFREGFIGKTMDAFGLTALSSIGRGRSVMADGLARRFMKGLFGKTPGPSEAEIRLAAAQGGQEVRRLTARAAEAEAKIAEKQFGLTRGNPVWDAWLDLVKGPISPKTGRRLKGSGLEGKAATKAAKESGLDVVGERNRVVSTLMSAAMRRNEQTGEVLFDLPAVDAAWRSLKQSPDFQRLYGNVTKTGTFSPGKVAKQVDKFLEDMLTEARPDATTLTADAILRRGSQDVIQAVEGGLQRAQRLREEFGAKVPKKVVNSVPLNAAAVALEQVISQDGFDEARSIIEAGDWMGFLDFFDTLEEKAAAVEQEDGG